MKTFIKNILVVGLILTVAACGRFRMGERVPEVGPVAPIEFEKVSDEKAAKAFSVGLISDESKKDEVVVKGWQEMTKNLAAPTKTSIEKRNRIGRILEASKKDKSGNRTYFAELWAIAYGQNLKGSEAEAAEKRIFDEIFQEEDASVTIHTWMLLAKLKGDLGASGDVDKLDAYYSGKPIIEK